MRVQTIRSLDDMPGQLGRVRFVVRLHVLFERGEESLLTRYGAPALEAQFPDDRGLKQIRTAAGISQTFDSVRDALAWIDLARAAAEDDQEYWKIAEQFEGRDDA